MANVSLTAFIQAAKLKAAKDGVTVKAVVEAIVLGQFESSVVNGRTIVSTSEAGGSVDLAGVALRSGLEWIEQALPHVPPECVDSFRVRNPANRALLARATRLDTATPGPGA